MAPAAVDRYLLSAGRSAANPPAADAAAYLWDGRTDGQADVRDDANALSLFDQTDRTCTDTGGGGTVVQYTRSKSL